MQGKINQPIKMANKVWKIILIITGSFSLFFLESIIKYSIVNKIPSQGFYLIPKILQIVYAPNYNIAFSLPLPAILIIILVILALIFLSYIWWVNLQTGDLKILTATSLIIIGALSNLIDRLIFSYVIDYINIFIWPIFNLADVMIVIGIFIYLFHQKIFNIKKEV